ncbi:hypothetical protein DVB73_08345 [Pseudomonas plecoglossicida]|uniref:Uncharacterized protein n=1 Tax=Pseudomonas plecoglossicida TaxID=70775 RepID=A0AAD0QVY3_PSEDL|nr:hypothetical protein DVB73_08345 [Pseudomonas plecoglossicida]
MDDLLVSSQASAGLGFGDGLRGAGYGNPSRGGDALLQQFCNQPIQPPLVGAGLPAIKGEALARLPDA